MNALPTREQVVEALRHVMDPELGRSLVDLGMVRDVRVEDGCVELTLAVTTMACSLKEYLATAARAAVMALPDVREVQVELSQMTELERLRLLGGVSEPEASHIQRVVAVSSGKAGVGQSMVTALLAAELARRGRRVGILDADAAESSIHTLLGLESRPIAGRPMPVPLKGEMADPREAGIPVKKVKEPAHYLLNRNFLIPPKADSSKVTVIKGPNIKDVSVKEALRDSIEAEVLLSLGDNITTDDIMPAGSKILPLRSNIPAIANFVFSNVDTTFSVRALEAKGKGGGIIIGGENYGQGSSREHAAIAPMFLGIQAVIAKSFARIHRSNLINFGILPLQFENAADYEKLAQGDRLVSDQ